MKNHPPLESLSALVDDDLGKRERARVEGHLGSCAECSDRKQQLEEAARSLRSLPEIEMTDDERRQLLAAVATVARARPTLARKPWWARRWLAPGLAAGALAAVGAWLWMAAPTDLGPAPPEVVASGNLRVDDASGIRRVVSGLPEVRRTLGRYSARVLTEGQADPAERFANEDSSGSTARSRKSPGGQADSAAAPEGASPPGEELPAPASTPAPGEFSRSAGLTCLEKVSAAQRVSVLPVSARKAEFRGQPAWLLTYTWTSSKDPEAKLDQIQVWVVSAPDCANFSGSDLLNRVMHFSAF